MNLEKSRTQNFFSYIIFFIFFTNLFFGYGMQITTIYVLPLNEILLLILLISINHFSLFKKISFSNFLTPYLMWFIYGFVLIAYGATSRGIWALRDGTYIIDSLFIFVGFAFFSSERNINLFFKLLIFCFYIGLFYTFIYLFKDSFLAFSPNVSPASGTERPISLFFNFTSASLSWIWLACLPIIFNEKLVGSLFYKITPFILLSASLILLQSRATYLSLFSVVVFLLYNNKISIKDIIIFILLLFLLFPIISSVGIKIAGRFGSPESIFFYIEHIMTMLPGFIPTTSGFEGASGTATQRIEWWAEIINNSLSSIKILLFGKGYGVELVDFRIAYGVSVREPHNGFLSIFARSGLIGLLLFIWLHVVLIRNWLSAYKFAKSNNHITEKNYLLYLGSYIIIIFVAAIADSMFQYPYYAILYYFFWGIILRIGYNFKAIKN